jgi:hypothetical protein
MPLRSMTWRSAAITVGVDSSSTQLRVVDLAGGVVEDHGQVVPALVLKPLVLAAIDVQQHPRSELWFFANSHLNPLSAHRRPSLHNDCYR